MIQNCSTQEIIQKHMIPTEDSIQPIQVFNVKIMMSQASKYVSDLVESRGVNINSAPWYYFHKAKQDLLNGTISLECKNEANVKSLQDAITIYNSIPPIIEFSHMKPVMPVFELIPTTDKDSNEILGFIRRCNLEFIGYHCNHKVIDGQCNSIIKYISDLYDSKEFKAYDKLIDQIASYVAAIWEADRVKREWKEDPEYTSPKPSYYDIEKGIQIIIKINATITKYNSKTVQRCTRCESMVRKYNYILSEVERMRADNEKRLEQVQMILDTPDDERYNIASFMTKNYSNIERIPLREVQQRYKLEFGLKITQDVLANEIISTGLYTVTASHNVKYVTRK